MRKEDLDNLVRDGQIEIEDNYASFTCDNCGKACKLSVSGLLHSKKSIFTKLCPLCKSKQTSLAKYGVDNPAKSPEIQNKMKKTCLERFGSENYFSSEIGKKHIEEVSMSKYGAKSYLSTKQALDTRTKSNLEKYGVENISSLQETKDKVAKTCLERYGSTSVFSSDSIKKKIRETLNEKYGVDYISSAPEIKEKVKRTNLDRYGVESVFSSDEIKERIKKTNLERYGYENPGQRPEQRVLASKRWRLYLDEHSHELRQKCAKKYEYESLRFDSSWELAYFIWLVDHDVDFNYQCDPIEYYDKYDKKHLYFPDFEIDGQLIEIKGDHFFEDDKMINPFDRDRDFLQEAKYNCMLENSVKIMKSKDCQQYIDYVKATYGVDFLEKCRT